MFRLLRPSLFVDSIRQVPPSGLIRQGIRGVIVDLDNTITEWNKDDVPPEVLEWLNKVLDHGIKVCLVSNNGKKRVSRISGTLGIPCVFNAGKPWPRAFRRAMAELGTRQEDTAVMGDQLFTDILGGNRLGLYTVLVVPLSGREFFGTRLIRWLERLLLRYLQVN